MIIEKETVNNLDAALEKIWALCKNSSVTVDSFLETRRHDNEIEETQYRQYISNVTADHYDFDKIEIAEPVPFFWFR